MVTRPTYAVGDRVTVVEGATVLSTTTAVRVGQRIRTDDGRQWYWRGDGLYEWGNLIHELRPYHANDDLRACVHDAEVARDVARRAAMEARLLSRNPALIEQRETALKQAKGILAARLEELAKAQEARSA